MAFQLGTQKDSQSIEFGLATDHLSLHTPHPQSSSIEVRRGDYLVTGKVDVLILPWKALQLGTQKVSV